MDNLQAVSAFSALSQITRLQVLRALVVAGKEGLAAGKLAEMIGVAPSNISFHLKEMEHAQLIACRRQGRSLIYSARFEVLGDLVQFMIRDCCSGHAATPEEREDLGAAAP
ncbi:MAG: ArsR/SmtB family transcription factor [Pseudorhizobium sp.]